MRGHVGHVKTFNPMRVCAHARAWVVLRRGAPRASGDIAHGRASSLPNQLLWPVALRTLP